MTIISNTWERIKDEFDRSISIEHRDPMGYSSSRSTNGPVLEELKIWSCELPVYMVPEMGPAQLVRISSTLGYKGLLRNAIPARRTTSIHTQVLGS